MSRLSGVVAAEDGSQMSGTSRSSRTVLLVDDSDSLRELLRGSLESMRMTVLEASSAAESISIAATYPQKIDLLLTDIDMEGSSGWESALTIAKLRPEIRVIYMSGGVSSLDWNACEQRPPGSYFLQKPFRSEYLNAVLKCLFPETQERQEGCAQFDGL